MLKVERLGDSVKKINHPQRNKERHSSKHKSTQEGGEKAMKADKDKSRDLLMGPDITSRIGDNAQGRRVVNAWANRQAPDLIHGTGTPTRQIPAGTVRVMAKTPTRPN